MKEYKPFLKIIQEMKDDDIADCKQKGVMSIVKRNGAFYYFKPSAINIDEGRTNPWIINDTDFKLEYAIRPNYVGLVEAMEAFANGRKVDWYTENGELVAYMNSMLSFNAQINGNKMLGERAFTSLKYGKFVIKES